jgi:hypothetical protein
MQDVTNSAAWFLIGCAACAKIMSYGMVLARRAPILMQIQVGCPELPHGLRAEQGLVSDERKVSLEILAPS